MSFKFRVAPTLAHTCCHACRTGDYSHVPERDMDGCAYDCAYDCGCDCEACMVEMSTAYDAFTAEIRADR